MKYAVDLGGASVDVDVVDDRGSVDGEVRGAHLADLVGTSGKLLTLGGTQHRVFAHRRAPGRYALWVDGWRFEVDALAEHTRVLPEASSIPAAGPWRVLAPMPALVLSVAVEVGDQVVAGQAVAVLEAMKMENAIRAPAAGVVRSVEVEAGAIVQKGAVLVEIAAL